MKMITKEPLLCEGEIRKEISLTRRNRSPDIRSSIAKSSRKVDLFHFAWTSISHYGNMAGFSFPSDSHSRAASSLSSVCRDSERERGRVDARVCLAVPQQDKLWCDTRNHDNHERQSWFASSLRKAVQILTVLESFRLDCLHVVELDAIQVDVTCGANTDMRVIDMSSVARAIVLPTVTRPSGRPA